MSANLSDRAAAHMLERAIFFSDAVFAIAITLLVIEIEIPTLETNDWREALHHLARLLPSFFGFLISFLVIGRFWISHHNALGNMEQYSHRLLWPNLLLLMAICFTPFATGFLSRNIGLTVPALFYNGLLVLTGLASARVISIATDPRFARKDMPEGARRDMRQRSWSVVAGAVTAFAAGFFVPLVSQFFLATIPLWRLGFKRFIK